MAAESKFSEAFMQELLEFRQQMAQDRLEFKQKMDRDMELLSNSISNISLSANKAISVNELQKASEIHSSIETSSVSRFEINKAIIEGNSM